MENRFLIGLYTGKGREKSVDFESREKFIKKWKQNVDGRAWEAPKTRSTALTFNISNYFPNTSYKHDGTEETF